MDTPTRLMVRRASHGRTFRALRLAALDPFLGIAHYWMTGPTFGAHSHAGFSAVTYMFEDSQGSFLNRDSLGDHSIIGPGDLHWTAAGAGIVHDETPTIDGQTCHGLQMFVDLAPAMKSAPPQVLHLESNRMPRIEQGGAIVKIVFGEFVGTRSPITIPTEATLLDVTLAPGALFEARFTAEANVFFHVIRGAVAVDDQTFNEAEAARMTPSAVGRFVATDGAQMAVFAGRPLNEPMI